MKKLVSRRCSMKCADASLICMAMLMALFSSTSPLLSAVVETWIDDAGQTWTYYDSGDTVAIKRYQSAIDAADASVHLTIPDMIDGKAVTSIGQGAFGKCQNLTSVTIPNGVTKIGYNAFNGCRNLASITIPDGVTEIGLRAFVDCQSLESITIPDGVGTVHLSVFDKCSNLASVTFKGGVGRLLGKFSECDALSTVVFEGNPPARWDKVLEHLKPKGGRLTVYVPFESTGWGLDVIPFSSRLYDVRFSDGDVDISSSALVGMVDTYFNSRQDLKGVLHYAAGNLIGTVQITIGRKMGNGTAKISATASTIEKGVVKKANAKSLKFSASQGPMRATLTFKDGIGTMDFTLDSHGYFMFRNDGCEMRAAAIGGALPSGHAIFSAHLENMPDFGDGKAVVAEALPDGMVGTISGKRIDFGKTGTLRFVQDDTDGRFVLAGLADAEKPNVAKLKISYMPRQGAFKGTFMVYAGDVGAAAAKAKPKLEKFKVNFAGFVINEGEGVVGIGNVGMKNPSAGPWQVRLNFAQ